MKTDIDIAIGTECRRHTIWVTVESERAVRVATYGRAATVSVAVGNSQRIGVVGCFQQRWWGCAAPYVAIRTARSDVGLLRFDASGICFHTNKCLRFISPDPLADKYPNISPYAYCAGNPMLYTDPDGREIWIANILYQTGMSYKGKDDFVKKMVDALNTISRNGGNDLLFALVKSDTKYNYTKGDSGKPGSTSKRDKDNVDIKITANQNEKNSFTSMVAHESMHGAQYENGQGGPSDYNEVEAYGFEYRVSMNSFDSDNDMFNSNAISVQETPEGKLFEQSIIKLSNNHSVTDMVNAVKSFKKGANANNTGLYNNYPQFNVTFPRPLLKKYRK